MAKAAAAMVLVLVATLGTFIMVTDQLIQDATGTVSLQFASIGLGPHQDPTSTGTVTDVVIRFTRVDIHAADSPDNNGWQTITVDQKIVDFASPTSVDTILGGASLPAGTYNMIRLFTDHATVSINAVQRTMMISSGDQTGIKVPMIPGGFTLTDGGTADVTLTFTFNAHELAANPRNMVPVVKAEVSTT